jgi:uncharacterized protein (TIGR02118 family)
VYKITVIYNLPPGADEEEFVRWRTTVHHAANIKRAGVLTSDFYRIIGTPPVGEERPGSDTAPYRFMTESWYNTLEEFRADWENEAEQARLVAAFTKIADPLVMISEEVQTYIKPGTKS